MLAVVCIPEQLNELGDKVRQAKKMAQTPPFSTDHPPLNTLLVPGMGLVSSIGPAATPAATASEPCGGCHRAVTAGRDRPS
jgi:hypothetical protein